MVDDDGVEEADLAAENRALRARIEALQAQLESRSAHDRSREAFFLRVFEDAPIGLALVGLDERIAEANAALCDMLGYSREALLRLTVPDITHPDDADVEVEHKAGVQEGRGGAFQVEKRYVRADGGVLLGRLSVSTLFDDEGSPSYFVGQLEDVTRERAAEDGLRASEAMFRALVESTSELFVLISAEGSASFVSPAMTELLGWTPAERRGRPFEDLVHEEDREAFATQLERSRAEPGGALRALVRLVRKDGRAREFDVVGRNLEHLPGIEAVVMTLRDVTEQRRLQEHLAHAQRLDSIGRLAGGVAHDFNNMLSAILGFADFLAESIVEGRPQLDDVTEIREAALKARGLTQQLLAVGRRQAAAPRPTNVNRAIRDAAGLMRRVLGEDVELSLALEPGVGSVLIDPTHLEQVLLNLVTNARDAMQGPGRVQVRTRGRVPWPAGFSPDAAPGVQLTVEDSGHGMSADTLEHVFEPFYTTKAMGAGTGLGLATVYGVVQQAGGHVWAESEPGVGTSFHVLFHVAAEAPEVDEPEVAPATGATGTVLVVEDEPAIRRMVARALGNAGFEVLTATDARGALELAASCDTLDLVVTDVVMPGMGGLELVERLQAQLSRELAVVFMSGYARAAQGEIGGHAGFLAKPFTLDALLAKVRERLPREGE